MKIQEKVLYIETPMEDADASELASVLVQEDIEEVSVGHADLSASILQLLMAYSKEKKVNIQEPFAKTLFQNLHYR
jgi:hypothetical protein